VILVLTVDRDGIYINDDWNAIGLRQTDSGSVRFDGVRVLSHELLGSRSNQANPFQSFLACLTQ
jgi:alkylation response protein AidB-like acyl-CoA dehydrogenase